MPSDFRQPIGFVYAATVSFWSRLFGRASASSPTPAELRLQFYGSEVTSLVGDDVLLSRPLTHAIRQVVVVVAASGEKSLTRREANALGLDDQEIFRIAEANVVAADLSRITKTTLDTDHGALELFVSNALHMCPCVRTVIERTGQDALVVFLTWHHAIVHTLGSASVDGILETIAELADRLDASVKVDPAERLSKEVVLYRALERDFLTVRVDEGERNLHPRALRARLTARELS